MLKLVERINHLFLEFSFREIFFALVRDGKRGARRLIE
jgi:hypothetical protein